jgi:predicted DNA-binding transcriptional regulator AlpA
MPDNIVGQKEIADRLQVAPNTVYQWAKRGLLPPVEGTVGGDPAWHWSTIEAWAQSTGRMPGLREAILELLMAVGAGSTSPLANNLIERGFGRSIAQVWRAINDLFHEGLVGYRIPGEWFISDLGRQIVEARRLGAAKPSTWDDSAQLPANYVDHPADIAGGWRPRNRFYDEPATRLKSE